MTEAIKTSTQSTTLQPFYYEDSVESSLAAWGRAGVLNFFVCSVFNQELMSLDSNCPSHGSSSSIDGGYVSVSVFSIAADDALEQYENWLMDTLESSRFKEALNSNTNDKLNENMGKGRRLQEYNGFQVIRIDILDPWQFTNEPADDNEDKSQNANDKSSSTAIPVTFACILVVLAVIANIYSKKKKREEMERRVEMQQTIIIFKKRMTVIMNKKKPLKQKHKLNR
eukprot:301272_1